MGIRKRTLIAWAVAVAAVALLASVWGRGDTARPARAQDDWCGKLQQVIDAFNRGEIDHPEDYADDMVLQATPLCDEVECVGRDAYLNYLGYLVDVNTQLTITSCEVSGDTVAVTYEFAMDPVRAAGVDRVIGYVAYEFEGETLLSSRQAGFDFADPQTLQYVQYATARPRPTFEMGPGRDADQSPGEAEMYEYPDFVGVFVRIAPGPAGVPQPIHIHEGTCASLGDVAISLEDVDGGLSHTILRGASLSDVQTGNHAVVVQKSHDEPDVYVACGDIPAALAEVPPAERAPAPVATGFADANGAHLYYEVYGEGEPLLLIPGLGTSHVFWADEVPAYAPEFKVIVFDPRGTGQSPFPEEVDLTMAVMADDAAALLDALDVDSAHVYGISMGGSPAQEMALRHPEKVRSLILGASTPGGPHAIPAENWAVTANVAALTQGAEAPNFLETLFSPTYLAEHRPEAIQYFEERLVGDLPVSPQVYAAQVQAMGGHDTYDRLPSITAPTLVVHGAEDPLVPSENARILADRIPGAELILVEGARHNYLFEKRAEANGAVLDFLRRHLGQAPAPALPAAGSGGVLDEGGSRVQPWWYALGAGGALLIVGGLAGLRKRSHGRG